jgi:hypothetical protein
MAQKDLKAKPTKVEDVDFTEIPTQKDTTPINGDGGNNTVTQEIQLLIRTGKLEEAHGLLNSAIKSLPANVNNGRPEYNALTSLYNQLNEAMRHIWYSKTNTSDLFKLQHGYDFIQSAIDGAKAKPSMLEIITYLNNKVYNGKPIPKDGAKLTLIAEDEAYSLIDFKPRQGYVAMLGFYTLTKGDILKKKFDLREGNLYIIGHNDKDKGVSIGDRVAVNVVPNPYLIDAGLPNDINRIDASRFDTMANSNLKEVGAGAAAAVIKDLKTPVGEETPKPKINFTGLPKMEVTVIILMSIATVMANKSLTADDIAGNNN